MVRKLIAGIMVILLLLTSVSCASGKGSGDPSDGGTAGKNGEVFILFTSDVHCAVSEGFGYAGLYQIRSELDNQLLIEFITESLGGEVGMEYADPYGSGRIVIIDAEE